MVKATDDPYVSSASFLPQEINLSATAYEGNGTISSIYVMPPVLYLNNAQSSLPVSPVLNSEVMYNHPYQLNMQDHMYGENEEKVCRSSDFHLVD